MIVGRHKKYHALEDHEGRGILAAAHMVFSLALQMTHEPRLHEGIR